MKTSTQYMIQLRWRAASWGWAFCSALALPACSPAANPDATAAAPVQAQAASAAAPRAFRPAGAPKAYTLGVVGYNYTNQSIASFEVDGTWGGNLSVSTPESGGGGTTCCYAWSDATSLPATVRVRWVSGGCTFMSEPSKSGFRAKEIQHYFSEKEVPIVGTLPAQPTTIEVHFYPDGRIEAAITDTESEPKLKLSPDRAVDPYPETCKSTP
ncbi:DUF3304 domain-containing protein [Ideonella sp.]|uniref:DUF3304 domain-containing protein n=1 Tax=Ideonella sp. TaxID=1929293 RepID=UPI0037BF66B8